MESKVEVKYWVACLLKMIHLSRVNQARLSLALAALAPNRGRLGDQIIAYCKGGWPGGPFGGAGESGDVADSGILGFNNRGFGSKRFGRTRVLAELDRGKRSP